MTEKQYPYVNHMNILHDSLEIIDIQGMLIYMRRSEKEILDPEVIHHILKQAQVCRLAMCLHDQPYIVPLCFGYHEKTLYFHSAASGKKIELLRQNSNVCFEVDIEQRLKPANSACKWGMQYRSVIGLGRAYFISEVEEKRQALDIIMAHYGEKSSSYSNSALRKTTVFKVVISEITGKHSDE